MWLCDSNYLAKHQSSAVSVVLAWQELLHLDFKSISSFFYTYCKIHTSYKKTLKKTFLKNIDLHK